MSIKDDEFLSTLRATFMVEAQEHVQTITTGVLALERTEPSEVHTGLVETVFRAAHSLKGAARAVDFTDIESLCEALETLFAAWKRQESAPSRQSLDSVHRTLDAVGAALAVPSPSRPPLSGPRQAWFEPDRAVAVPAAVVSVVPGAGPGAAFPEETVRISVAKLDARLLEAEELLTAKLAASQRAEDVRRLANRFGGWKHDWMAVEPAVRGLRQAMNRAASGWPPDLTQALTRLLEFFDRNIDHLDSIEGHVTALRSAADHDRQVTGKLVDDLLEESKKLLLLPFATLAAPFPKLVRDLCRDQGKEADLVVHGEAVEIDKRILEAMKDPLIHLLRNAVDHGAETPGERLQLGKPSRATITLAASRVNGNKVEILVSDDGAGIDVDKTKASAIQRGFLSTDESHRLGDAEARQLIFTAEVSTSPMITRLSGRGLGLAIVREKAEKLGGTVAVESRQHEGTRFSIVLPATLATFRGILVEAAQRLFVVPTIHVERVARVKANEILTVEGRDTVSLSGRAVALVRLAGVLGLPPAGVHDVAPGATLVLVIGTGDQRVAFAVDDVLDEQEVLVRPLRPPLSRVRNIAGATVLGSGQVVPILNVIDLLKSARMAADTSRTAGLARPASARPYSVLVVEDSITSRMLIKSILESAGYSVKTAVDGLTAFTLLRAAHFDLVVSDVEMPRLNGFDLTAKIRADKRLAELPVVLVTAIETREDRERGIDAGANAYIVKSSFDQRDLLDAVRRLV